MKFADYIHPTYKQNFEPFIPNMATIDLLFNEGDKSKHILMSNNLSKPQLEKL